MSHHMIERANSNQFDLSDKPIELLATPITNPLPQETDEESRVIYLTNAVDYQRSLYEDLAEKNNNRNANLVKQIGRLRWKIEKLQKDNARLQKENHRLAGVASGYKRILRSLQVGTSPNFLTHVYLFLGYLPGIGGFFDKALERAAKFDEALNSRFEK